MGPSRLCGHMATNERLSNQVISWESVVVHHHNFKASGIHVNLWDIELKGLVEDWCQCVPLYAGFPLGQPRPFVYQKHLHIRVCTGAQYSVTMYRNLRGAWSTCLIPLRMRRTHRNRRKNTATYCSSTCGIICMHILYLFEPLKNVMWYKKLSAKKTYVTVATNLLSQPRPVYAGWLLSQLCPEFVVLQNCTLETEACLPRHCPA